MQSALSTVVAQLYVHGFLSYWKCIPAGCILTNQIKKQLYILVLTIIILLLYLLILVLRHGVALSIRSNNLFLIYIYSSLKYQEKKFKVTNRKIIACATLYLRQRRTILKMFDTVKSQPKLISRKNIVKWATDNCNNFIMN